MIEIQPYTEEDCEEVIALVLSCQNDGTRPFVSVNDQPELLNIREKYIAGGGNFWVAKDHGKVAGCIGLMLCGDGLAILKKFFVYALYRGTPHNLGRQLYTTLSDYAKENGVQRLLLDTPRNTDRAHKFYEKAGFQRITKEEVPILYEYPYADSDFFLKEIE